MRNLVNGKSEQQLSHLLLSVGVASVDRGVGEQSGVARCPRGPWRLLDSNSWDLTERRAHDDRHLHGHPHGPAGEGKRR